MLTIVDRPIHRDALVARVFNGELLHFQQLPAMHNFCAIARQRLRKALSGRAPVTAHRHYSPEELLERLSEYQDLCRQDSALHATFRQTIADLGFDLDDTYWDRFILRAVPPRWFKQNAAHMHVDLHRDTWGANIHQQINWWAAIYPLAQNRTIAFFPEHWTQGIKNSTASWRFANYLAASKQPSENKQVAYPQVPQALEEPQGPPLRPVIKPGDLLCFSAAHLHASVPNYSDFTRYSFETRTVSWSDINADRRAPNVDNAGTEQMPGLFSHINSGEKLSGNIPLSPLLKDDSHDSTC